MTPAQVIVLAMPVFLVLIALEIAVDRARGSQTYRLNDALASMGLGLISQLSALFTAFFTLGVYTLVFEHAALWRLPADSPALWLAALLAYDFLYYWNHRAGHRVAVLWAAHAVHHQSEAYNLSTALRQPSSYFLFSPLFYLPLAVAGVPPLVFAVVGLVDLLYQFWVHTQQIGRLGWFDRWFCSPSNHRVHHAVNDRYLDRNYGGILIVWDRLFGSYAAEDDAEPIVYGTRAPLSSFNPLWAHLQVYAGLAQDCWHSRSAADRLRVWWKPPGWRPADVAQRFPKPAFDLAQRRTYNPPLPRASAALAVALFAVALGATSLLLWQAHRMAGPQVVVAALVLIGLLGAIGRLTQPRAGAAAEGAGGLDAAR